MTAAALSMSLASFFGVLGGLLLALELGKRIARRVTLPIRRTCWICRERLAGPWHNRYCPSSHRHIERLYR